MKKIYTLFLMMVVAVLSMSAQNYYNGKLNVEMMGSKIADNMDARVSLTEDSEGNYTFSLPDFRITVGEAEVECGDIVVKSVKRTIADDGSFTITGSTNNLSLAQGEIHARVNVEGTESAAGKMSLTIVVGWYTEYPTVDDEGTITPINVTFDGNLYPSVTDYFDGKLNVEMSGTVISTDKAATVQLMSIGEDTYLFKLPNFVLPINGGNLDCGDILVEGVTRTLNSDGSYTIEGETDDLGLAQGQLHAKVNVTGTESADHKIDLAIVVGWYAAYPDMTVNIVPINVTFEGTLSAGVNEIVAPAAAKIVGTAGAIEVANCNGRVAVYTVDGRKVVDQHVNGQTTVNIANGLYIVRAGNTSAKVIVK